MQGGHGGGGSPALPTEKAFPWVRVSTPSLRPRGRRRAPRAACPTSGRDQEREKPACGPPLPPRAWAQRREWITTLVWIWPRQVFSGEQALANQIRTSDETHVPLVVPAQLPRAENRAGPGGEVSANERVSLCWSCVPAEGAPGALGFGGDSPRLRKPESGLLLTDGAGDTDPLVATCQRSDSSDSDPNDTKTVFSNQPLTSLSVGPPPDSGVGTNGSKERESTSAALHPPRVQVFPRGSLEK